VGGAYPPAHLPRPPINANKNEANCQLPQQKNKKNKEHLRQLQNNL